MQPPRRLAAQGLMVIVAAAMFLTWVQRDLGGSMDESVSGIDVSEGQLTLIVSLLTIGLVQAELRPAWMGAGFACAIVGRQLFDALGEDRIEPGLGLWLAAVSAAVAAVLLVVDMFSSIDRPSVDPGGGP